MVAARSRDVYDEMAKERQKLSQGQGVKGVANGPHLNTGKSRDAAGAAFGIGGRTVDRRQSFPLRRGATAGSRGGYSDGWRRHGL